MAQLSNILALEKERDTIVQCRQIHLHLEGTFYHLYEWSAWLFTRYVQAFKLTHKLVSGSGTDTMVMTGFPMQSLSKHLGEGLEPDENGLVTVSLGSDTFGDGETEETLKTDFENWKRSIPLTEKSKARVEEQRGATGERTPRLTDILHDVLSYPIEQKSPMETMSFMMELKSRIAKIL